MKNHFLVLFMLSGIMCYGQPENRPRSIYFDNAEKYPISLMPLKDWMSACVSKLPLSVKFLKTSPKQDANYQMLSLLLGRLNRFPIGNSGNFLELGYDSMKSKTMNIEYEGRWKLMAYQPNFNVNKFDAHNNQEIFLTSTLIFNISEEQALAQFLNNYVKGSNQSKLKTLADDLYRKYEIKLDVADYNTFSLTDFAKEISAKTNFYASYVCFMLYLEDKDYKKECRNLEEYYRKFTPESVIENFLDKVAIEGKLALKDTLAVLELTDKGFTFVDDNNNPLNGRQKRLRLQFKQLSYKIMYDRKRDYEPYLKLDFENISIKDSCFFNIVNEGKLNPQLFPIVPFKTHSVFKSKDIASVSLHLYSKSIVLKMRMKTQSGYAEDYIDEYMVSEEKIKYE